MTALADNVRALTGGNDALTLDAMASGLSEQLTYVENALDAVAAKGAAVPDFANLSALAGLIESISAGGTSALLGYEIDVGSFTPGETLTGGYTVQTRFTTDAEAPRSDVVICFLDNGFTSVERALSQYFVAGIYVGNVYSHASSGTGEYKEDAVGFYYNANGQKAYLTSTSYFIEFIIGENGEISFKVPNSANARLLAGDRYSWIYIRRAVDW